MLYFYLLNKDEPTDVTLLYIKLFYNSLLQGMKWQIFLNHVIKSSIHFTVSGKSLFYFLRRKLSASNIRRKEHDGVKETLNEQ